MLSSTARPAARLALAALALGLAAWMPLTSFAADTPEPAPAPAADPLADARAQVATLKRQIEADPAALSRRQHAARSGSTNS